MKEERIGQLFDYMYCMMFSEIIENYKRYCCSKVDVKCWLYLKHHIVAQRHENEMKQESIMIADILLLSDPSV